MTKKKIEEQNFLDEQTPHSVERKRDVVLPPPAVTGDTLPPVIHGPDPVHSEAHRFGGDTHKEAETNLVTCGNIIVTIGQALTHCQTVQHGDYQPQLALCIQKLQEAQAHAQAAHTSMQPKEEPQPGASTGHTP